MKLNKIPLLNDALFKSEVILDISPKDGMHSLGADESYLNVGYSAIKNIKAAMAVIDKKEVKSILDFGCGYGRVLRMLKASYPQAIIVACDYEKDGVDFCTRTFNVTGVYSKENPEETEMKENFDIIWVGSLFTHFDQHRWHKALAFFISHLMNFKGILVFTTHGRTPAEWMYTGRTPYNVTAKQLYGLRDKQFEYLVAEYKNNGFAYVNYAHFNNWGISLSSPSWTVKQLEKFNNIELIYYLEHGWGNHQDVVAISTKLDK